MIWVFRIVRPNTGIRRSGRPAEARVAAPGVQDQFVPHAVVTVTFAVAPRVVAAMDVSLVTEKELAGAPPNVTEVAPVKYSPEMVIDVPLGLADQVAGVRLVTIGAGQSWMRWELPWARLIATCRKASARDVPEGALK